MKNIDQKFKQVILNTFNSERIISLLYYGTRAFNINLDENSDYDFLLILDQYHFNDLTKLRKVIQRKPFRSLDINLNFVYSTDIKARGKINFQIRSTMSNFYEYLSTAKILIGKDLFLKDPLNLTRNKLVKEFDFKIQEYYGRCDKLFFQNLSDKDLYLNLTKYTRDIIKFILVREGQIAIKDLAKFSCQQILELIKMKRFFPEFLIKKLSVLLKPRLFKNKEDILVVNSVRRLIYKEYLKFFKQNK